MVNLKVADSQMKIVAVIGWVNTGICIDLNPVFTVVECVDNSCALVSYLYYWDFRRSD